MQENRVTKQFELIKSSLNDLHQNQKGEIYFFIIAVDAYLKENDLKHSRRDANEMLSIFHKHSNVKKKNIYTLFDENATKLNILKHLNNFQKILSSNDKIVIYFSGHGLINNYSNFFVPYDGDKQNYVSCITNSFIADSISEFKTELSILILDCNFSKTEYDTYKDNTRLEYIQTLRNKAILEKNANALYKDFLTFFSKKSYNRFRETYCFIKEDIFPSTHIAESLKWHNNKKLERTLNDSYSNLLKLVKEKRIEDVLKSLSTVLQNNDIDLKSWIETLQFKLDQINTSRNINAETAKEDRNAISQITCEVIERIKENGFYLVKTPKNKHARKGRKKERIKIVFTSANPRDENFLRLNAEARLIEFELLKAKNRDKFEFIQLKAINITELQDALLNHSPQFLHFSGHGSCTGISLLNEFDEAKLVRTKPLADLFKLFAKELNCIFLNSCHSIGQSDEIVKHVKKVVCMNNEVPDDVAINFAAAFYKSIGAGRDIDFSFNFAKNSIELLGITGSNIPVLLSN